MPRTLWRSRGRLGQFRIEARLLIREHWTKERITLVVLGLVCFYVTYVSYRNLKNFLPFVRGSKTSQGDYELHKFDQWLLFGHDPAVLLHNVLGTTRLRARAVVVLPDLPADGADLGDHLAGLVAQRQLRLLVRHRAVHLLDARHRELLHDPHAGPELRLPVALRATSTPTRGSQRCRTRLYYGRQRRAYDPFANGVQSVAGFASLHVAITLLMALVAQYTVRHRFIKVVLWVYMGITVLSTTYFGWHYIADDIAGALIAFIAFYLGGIATGQKFDEHGRHSHPTTTTSDVPWSREDTADASARLSARGRPSRRRRRSSRRRSRPGPGWRSGCPAARPSGVTA